MLEREVILGLDSVIGNGSLSLWIDEREVANKVFSASKIKSHSEILLAEILNLLKENDLQLKDLDFINVSRGPGSFTSLRVAFATVLGICNSVGCVGVGVSTADALFLQSSNERCLVGISVGRDKVYYKIFDTNASDNVATTANIKTFSKKLNMLREKKFSCILDENLVGYFEQDTGNLRVASDNVANTNVEYFLQKHLKRQHFTKPINLSPLYLKNNK